MVRDTIAGILVELGIAEDEITGEARLQGDLGLDSTETIQIGLDLKRVFGVEVRLSSGADLTVDEVCRLVQDKLPTPVGEPA